MNRQEFIRDSIILGVGLHIPYKNYATPPQGQIIARLAGYLIPIAIEKGLGVLFDKLYEQKEKPHTTINNSIVHIANVFQNNIDNDLRKISKSYNEHYTKIVIPNLGKKNLNGVGLNGADGKLLGVMNDHNSNAITPVHSSRQLDTFDKNVWAKYCDVSNLQISEDKIWVSTIDERPDKYKGVFWINPEFSYLLYDPKWYCWGLPSNFPTQFYLNEADKREIKEKTGLETKISSYWTQDFYYNGENSCYKDSHTAKTIWWGYENDEAFVKYYKLDPIVPCGDPTNCQAENQSRPGIRKL